MRGQSRGRIDPTGEHIDALHWLALGAEMIHEIDRAVNSRSVRWGCGRGIKAGKSRNVIRRELVRIRIANGDGHAVYRVHVMHDRKASIIVGGRMRIAGGYVYVHLRPAQAENISQHAHQSVLHVGKLRRLKCALPINYDQGMQEICAGV